MDKKTVPALMLTLLSIGMLTLAFNIQSVKGWAGTVYIRADGSIDPPDAPIVTYDNITYTLTDNITSSGDGIVVERDNIVIDGAGYTLEGATAFPYKGVGLSGRKNVTVRNTQIQKFSYSIYLYESSNNSIYRNNITPINFFGIYLDHSPNNSIYRNNATKNVNGIYLYESSNNSMYGNNVTANIGDGIGLHYSPNNSINGNNITKNDYGIDLVHSSNNNIYHNNFYNNTEQVYSYNSTDLWDNGYPSGGNYWSNYSGTDLYCGPHQNESGNDGIGDTAYEIDENNTDHYPLMHPWNSLPVHNINIGSGYPTIQEGIDAPETLNGHTIFVEAGTYYENVVVDKTVRLVGEGRDTAIIDGSGVGTVVHVTASGVSISNFRLRKSGDYPNSGIKVDANHCIITNNIIANNYEGIWLDDSSYNTVSGNNITANNGDGIWLDSSSNNNISGNSITNNGQMGFKLYVSSNNSISGNSITNNSLGIWLYISSNNNSISGNKMTNNDEGIMADLSDNNSISENDVIANNGDGIWLQSSSNNAIKGNNITANNDVGIYLYDSSNNSISGNDIRENIRGIWVYAYSNDNSIYENIIANNTYGIKLDYSSNNLIYHNNFIDNAEQTYSIGWVNVWDDGYPSGGNFWSDYIGNDTYYGPYQNMTGSDGIGDTPYVIDTKNQDNYPLMNPWGMGTPLASFTWTPSIAKVDESVTFDASSSTPNGGETVSYEWDFGDGYHASGKIVTYQYASANDFTVTLNITDSEGLWDTEQKQIQVVQPYGPEAGFTVTPETANVGENVKFDASASLPGWNGTDEMLITEYRWDFGDGNQTTTSTPTVYHSFTSSGNYYVALTVYAPGATPETDSTTHKVTVVSVPVGGHSLPIKGYTTAKPLASSIALIAILATAFLMVKHRKKQRLETRK